MKLFNIEKETNVGQNLYELDLLTDEDIEMLPANSMENFSENDPKSNELQIKHSKTPDGAMKLEKMQSSIQQMQAQFTLKIMSKHSLSQETVGDILTFCEDIHDAKMELLNEQLSQTFFNDENISMEKVTENIKLTDSVTGTEKILFNTSSDMFNTLDQV